MLNYANFNKTVLIKLSGEALANNNNIICPTKLNSFAAQIASVSKLGIKICIVIGGGNILRGASNNLNLTRFKADNMGMLATLINAIALQDCLQQNHINSVVLNSFEANKVAQFYTAETCLNYLNNKHVVVLAGGVANPYFSTDMCAVIRALETNCDLILKGTQVNGVYNADPKTNANAIKLNSVSYNQVIQQNLKVVDISAVTIAKNNSLPIVIFNIHQADNLINIVTDLFINHTINNNCSIIH